MTNTPVFFPWAHWICRKEMVWRHQKEAAFEGVPGRVKGSTEQWDPGAQQVAYMKHCRVGLPVKEGTPHACSLGAQCHSITAYEMVHTHILSLLAQPWKWSEPGPGGRRRDKKSGAEAGRKPTAQPLTAGFTRGKILPVNEICSDLYH